MTMCCYLIFVPLSKDVSVRGGFLRGYERRVKKLILLVEGLETRLRNVIPVRRSAACSLGDKVDDVAHIQVELRGVCGDEVSLPV